MVVVSVGKGEEGEKGKKVMMWSWGVSDKVWWCDTPSVTSLFNGKRLVIDSKLKQNFFRYLVEKNKC